MANPEGPLPPETLEEAENFKITDSTEGTTVKDILDLEKILIVLEQFGINTSLKGVLGKLDNIFSSSTFEADFAGDPQLQEIIVSSLEESIKEIRKFTLKTRAVMTMGGDYPDAIETPGEFGPEEIRESIKIVADLIGIHATRIQPLLNQQQKIRLGFEQEQEEETSPEGRKNPYVMTLEEVVDEISGIIIQSTDRSQELNARYFELIGAEKDAHKNSWFRVRRGIQAILVAGDSGVKGFDILSDAIFVELADKGVDFTNIARALFIKRPDKEGEVTSEEMDKAEIDMRALDVYDYIVKRIKHHSDYGGLDHDPDDLDNSDPNAGEDYSYYGLMGGDKLEKFEAHLRTKFSDIEPGLMTELIKYTQAMDGKSAGYIPWLMRAVTRAHGFALSGLRNETFSDQLFVAAPYAAAQYGRTRYTEFDMDASAEDILFIDPVLFPGMLEDTERTPDKLHAMKEAWKIINQYRDAVWDLIPDWVTDVREMITIGKEGDNVPETKLDLNSSWFPLPGEIVPNILRMEQRKRDVLAMPEASRPERKAKKAAKKKLLKEAKILGYGKKMDEIGIPQLTKLTVDQYKSVSFPAMEKFNAAFREKPEYLTKHQAIEKFVEWMDKIIGKAKLVPGPHHLLFGPFTVRMMHRLSISYEKGHTPDEVDALRMEMLKELKGAGGLPDAAREYVLKKVGGLKHIKTMVRYQFKIKRERFKGALWRFRNEFPISIEDKIKHKLPITMGKDNTPFEAPWNYDKSVNENTTASAES